MKKGYSKTDLRYWESRITKRNLTNGKQSSDYSTRIHFTDKFGIEKRERFSLGSPNKAKAAKQAQNIFLYLKANGWKMALNEFKAKPIKIKNATVGQWIEAAKQASSTNLLTFTDNCRELRNIVAYANNIKSPSTSQKTDSFKSLRKAWTEKIDNIRLSTLNKTKVKKWLKDYIESNSSNPIEETKATHTARSKLAKARSLFSEAIVDTLSEQDDIEVPDPLPFDGVRLPKIDRSSVRYKSKINLSSIFEKAFVELESEQLKVFILAVACGLRRGELDVLLWSQVDFENKVINMEKTIYTSLKSDHSANPIYFDEKVFELLKKWKAQATGEFVIEGREMEYKQRSWNYYRCYKLLREVVQWLRQQGVTAQKPIHELRKEAGRLVVEEYGIYAAKEFLRHGDIQITTQHYAEDKRRITPRIGSLLDQAS